MPDLSTPLPWLLTMASGGVVALLLTVFGGGGSVLAVPLLLYVVGVADAHVAVGVASAGVALNALTALYGHARAGRVKWPCASLFAAFGAVGAWAGSSLAKRVDGQSLVLIFAFAMIAVGLAMLRRQKAVAQVDVQLTPAMAPRVVAMGSGVGALAGFFGIGGGFLVVPGLMSSTGMALAVAQASSLLSVAAFGTSTAINYAIDGLISWPLVAALTVGGVAGTIVGLPLSRRLAAHIGLGRSLFAGLIILTAIYVMVRALVG